MERVEVEKLNKEILEEEMLEEKKLTENNLEEEILEGEEVENKEEERDPMEMLQEENGKLKIEIEDWKGAYQRKNAEFQNFTKRKEKEQEDLRKFAAEKVVLKVLEAIDNLERGIAASSETKDFESLVKGVEMTLGQMHNIMNSEGVEAIEAEGKEYDPYLHQAIMTENVEDAEDNQILMEVQKGYKMHGKVIRPSMVKVCKK